MKSLKTSKAQPEGANSLLDATSTFTRLDPQGMMGRVMAFPQWFQESAGWGNVTGISEMDHMCFAGMGGSSIPGESVKALYEGVWNKPMTVVRGGALPGSVGPHTLVFLVSCSGNTAETLELFEETMSRRALPYVIASGGKLLERATREGVRVVQIPAGHPPRASFPYLFGPILSAVHSLITPGRFAALLTDSVNGLGKLALTLSPESATGSNPAKQIARQLQGRRPLVVCSPGTGEPAGGRWRNQLAENSKVSADLWVAPECLHNVVEPFFNSAVREADDLPVLLRSNDEIPRVKKSMDALEMRLTNTGKPFVRVDAVGASSLERFLSLVLIADYVSVYLALLNGVDPTAIPEIEKIKGLCQ